MSSSKHELTYICFVYLAICRLMATLWQKLSFSNLSNRNSKRTTLKLIRFCINNTTELSFCSTTKLK